MLTTKELIQAIDARIAMTSRKCQEPYRTAAIKAFKTAKQSLRLAHKYVEGKKISKQEVAESPEDRSLRAISGE